MSIMKDFRGIAKKKFLNPKFVKGYISLFCWNIFDKIGHSTPKNLFFGPKFFMSIMKDFRFRGAQTKSIWRIVQHRSSLRKVVRLYVQASIRSVVV